MNEEMSWYEQKQVRHDQAKEEAGCKGLFFRYRENNYFHEGKLEFKKTFTKLKRMSCPGCAVCEFLESDLREEDLTTGSYGHIVFPKELMDQGVYELKVTNMSTDIESGYCDDWDIEFSPVKETNASN